MLIETTLGLMEADELEKLETVTETEDEIARAVEYRHAGELVHRSVHLHLKKGLMSLLKEQGFG